MADCVLDASAVLAWLMGEPGGEKVETWMPKGVICAVNLSEVVAKLVDRGDSEIAALTKTRLLALEVETFDEALALRAGALRTSTRRLGLSLGDRACLALAQRDELPVVTADHAWSNLDLGIDVRQIR